jgi:hypothetical protein
MGSVFILLSYPVYNTFCQPIKYFYEGTMRIALGNIRRATERRVGDALLGNGRE